MKPLAVGFRSESIDVTGTSWANTGTYGHPVGIYCNAATTITGKLCGDSVEASWVLAAGVVHPLSFSTINTSSTTKTGYRVLFER